MENILKQILSEVQTNNQKINGLEKRFDKIETRFNGLEKRFEKIETRFNGLEKRFEKIENRFDGLEYRFDGLEKRFDKIENRFVGLEKRFDHLDGEMKVLTNGQDELQLSLGQLKNNTINRVGSYTDEVAQHIDVRFDEMKGTSDDQQKIIQTLASRSITHESEINELKQFLNS